MRRPTGRPRSLADKTAVALSCRRGRMSSSSDPPPQAGRDAKPRHGWFNTNPYSDDESKCFRINRGQIRMGFNIGQR